jgi:hypothetical protein
MGKKRGPRKGGVLTLRIPPDVHGALAVTAAELGLDVTGLIRLMIRRSLPHFMLEARLISIQAEEAEGLLEQWRRAHPDRPVREFWDDYYQHQRTKAYRVEDDPRFNFDEAYAATNVDRFTAQPGQPGNPKPAGPAGAG